LEEGRTLGRLAVLSGPRLSPFPSHSLDDVGDEGLDRDLPLRPEHVERHLDGFVDGPPRPHLARGELFQDVQAAGLIGGRGLPSAPGAVVLVEVTPPAVVKGRVAAAGPGKLVRQIGHRLPADLRAIAGIVRARAPPLCEFRYNARMASQ